MRALILPVTALACLLAALSIKAAGDPASYGVPRFRHANPQVKAPEIDAGRQITLLADADFPPFSYADAGGNPKGLAVDLATALCMKVAIRCTVKLLTWEELAAALARGEGDAVISGLKPDETTLSSLDASRPLYRTLGRFAVRIETPITEPSLRLLAGKRIGVAKSSAHEAWLKRYYPYSQVIAQNSLNEAEAALREAKIDVLFGDSLSLVYWTEGQASQGCCRLVPGAFVDEDYFSRSFVFFVRRGDVAFKRVLDYGLDRLQEDGTWDRIFRAYVPASPW